jgi:hypothetical protein
MKLGGPRTQSVEGRRCTGNVFASNKEGLPPSDFNIIGRNRATSEFPHS